MTSVSNNIEQPTSTMVVSTTPQVISNPDSGLAEIAEVNVNKQGISYDKPILIDDSGSPLIELVDEDEIDNDFSD